MKFIIICFLLTSAYSFAMRVPLHDLSQKNVDNKLNELLCSKQKDVKIDVFDPQNVVERYQRRLKKTQCCMQACTWVGISCVCLAALCLKLEYGCECKQP